MKSGSEKVYAKALILITNHNIIIITNWPSLLQVSNLQMPFHGTEYEKDRTDGYIL